MSTNYQQDDTAILASFTVCRFQRQCMLLTQRSPSVSLQLLFMTVFVCTENDQRESDAFYETIYAV